jgi:hypothetical protein
MEWRLKMGSGRFDPADWDRFTTTATAGRRREAIFSSRTLKDSLDPAKARNLMRESRDSVDNPESTAIVVALDVTGSMQTIPEYMVREGLPALFGNIYDRKPVADPQVMFMGVGDVVYDRAPLQVSQFEADIRIADQLKELYLEGGGGGNMSESYTLPWYFAGLHTSLDCFEKRGKRGYLFTVGDEMVPETLTAAQIQRVIGITPQSDFTASQLLDLAGRQYHVFHVVVQQGANYRRFPDQVRESWTGILGQRALMLSDYTKLSEVIVSAIQITEGEDAEHVAASWGGGTAMVVRNATSLLRKVATSAGVRRF